MPAPGEKSDTSLVAEIRQMRSTDVSAVLSILRESPEATMWTEDSLLEWSARGDVWVAELDGRVAGLLIARVAADEMEILDLAVASAYRRRGVASHLVRAALDSGFAAGVERSYLELRASNVGGMAFYEQLGYQVCGRRSNYYRDPVEDAVLLVLPKGHKNF